MPLMPVSNDIFGATTSTDSSLYWSGSTLAVTNSNYYVYPNITQDSLMQTVRQISNIEPQITRKKFVSPLPEIAIPKESKLSFIGIDDTIEAAPLSLMERDVIKPEKSINGNHVYEVYDVPETPWGANSSYYDECIAAKGLRKTSMGFYIKDDKVKLEFRRRKIVELRTPPAFIHSRRILDRTYTAQEMKARVLLKRYVGEKEFKRYQRMGYIVMFAHGYMWRVPGERSIINRVEQFENGKCINKYCVHFADNNIPPTDACVMRMSFIHAGIETLKKYSNVTDGKYLNDLVFSSVEKKETKELTFVDAAIKVKELYNL